MVVFIGLFLQQVEQEWGGIEMEMEMEKMLRCGSGTITCMKQLSGANLLCTAATANSAKATGDPVGAKAMPVVGTVVWLLSVMWKAGEVHKALLQMWCGFIWNVMWCKLWVSCYNSLLMTIHIICMPLSRSQLKGTVFWFTFVQHTYL